MTFTDFTAWMAALQTLLVTAAIIVGGVWALFRFRVLGEREEAEAELAALRDALAREPAITLSIQAEVMHSVGYAHKSVHAVVRMKNLGRAAEVVDWGASGVSSARVRGFTDNAPLFEVWRTTRLATDLPWKGSDILPGEEAAYSFLIPAPQSGLYCLEAFIALSSRSTESSSVVIKAAGMSPKAGLEASSLIFVEVSSTEGWPQRASANGS